MTQLNIYTKRKIASKKKNLEHKCILQESCKTVRRWQISILHVRWDHCVWNGKKVWKSALILVCITHRAHM